MKMKYTTHSLTVAVAASVVFSSKPERDSSFSFNIRDGNSLIEVELYDD